MSKGYTHNTELDTTLDEAQMTEYLASKAVGEEPAPTLREYLSKLFNDQLGAAIDADAPADPVA